MTNIIMMIVVLWQADVTTASISTLNTKILERGSYINQPAEVLKNGTSYLVAVFRKDQLPKVATADLSKWAAISSKIVVVETPDGAKWLRDNGYTHKPIPEKAVTK